ncbi:hydroxyindole O-methyltransferase [Penicillium lividum]|nr:hydroxyindole O-methyltransferase [Penicillium lividum]
MRMVTAIGYAREASERRYLPSPLGNALTQPALEACLVHSFEHAAAVNIGLPDFLAKTGYRSPQGTTDGPFQHSIGTKLTFFEFLHNDPRKMHNFNTYMTGNRNLRKHWTTWYPVRQQFLTEWSSAGGTEILLVDMGGGRGHDLQCFVNAFPESHGHLVLQDLPGTIASLPPLEQCGITAMSHDLFVSPQPPTVLGAKVFFTHFLLHDFSDDQCRVMLQHVSRAMKPGYSKLLLNEAVLPERGCPSFFAAADITMMAVLSAKMRSRRQWIELVESAGLQVLQVWISPYHNDNEGVVEAIVPCN